MANGDGRLQVQGEAILFGFPSTKAILSVIPRPKAWRASGAALRMGIGVVVAAMMAIIPPHAPWILGALAVGAIMARRRWVERYTLKSVEGTCPKCGARLNVSSSRLRRPHPVSCEACHHESALSIPKGALPA